MKEKYYLIPEHDTRQSFYNKAIVERKNNTLKLYSYGVLVVEINKNKGVVVYGTYSNTTLRHIKEFLKQNGFKAENKQQIIKDYIKEV